MKPPVAHVRKTFCLPHVSAMKPQNCNVKQMPKNDIELNTPCSVVVRSKSHFALGNIKLTFRFSSKPPKTLKPVRMINIV